jgi:hypothetical protein
MFFLFNLLSPSVAKKLKASSSLPVLSLRKIDEAICRFDLN